jgi:hypothetical protein
MVNGGNINRGKEGEFCRNIHQISKVSDAQSIGERCHQNTKVPTRNLKMDWGWVPGLDIMDPMLHEKSALERRSRKKINTANRNEEYRGHIITFSVCRRSTEARGV